MVDPEFALFHMQRALWDPVDPALLGSLAENRRAKVNGEIYRFGSAATLQRFVAAPALYCGLLRDPVTGVRFWPSMRSPRFDWNGSPYYFANPANRETFAHNPLHYEIKRNL